MSCFFSSDCRTEWSEPSGILAASAKAAAFASTRLFSFIFVRSASRTALWRALSPSTPVDSTVSIFGAGWGALLGGSSTEALFWLGRARRRGRSRSLRGVEVFGDRLHDGESAIIKSNCRERFTAAAHSHFLFRQRVWSVDSAPRKVF